MSELFIRDSAEEESGLTFLFGEAAQVSECNEQAVVTMFASDQHEELPMCELGYWLNRKEALLLLEKLQKALGY